MSLCYSLSAFVTQIVDFRMLVKIDQFGKDQTKRGALSRLVTSARDAEKLQGHREQLNQCLYVFLVRRAAFRVQHYEPVYCLDAM